MTQPGTWSDTPLQTQHTWSNHGATTQWSDPGPTWSGERWGATPVYTPEFPPAEMRTDPHEMDSLVASTMQTPELPLNPPIRLNTAALPHPMPHELVQPETRSLLDQNVKVPSDVPKVHAAPRRSKNSRGGSNRYSRTSKRQSNGDGGHKRVRKGPSKAPVRRDKGDKTGKGRRSNSNNKAKKETKANDSRGGNPRSNRSKGRSGKNSRGNRGGAGNKKSGRSARGQSGRGRGQSGKPGGSRPVRRTNPRKVPKSE